MQTADGCQGEATTLAGATRRDKAFLAACAVAAALLYWRIVYEMGLQWWSDPNYSHGFLIPLCSAYFLWERRKELAATPASPSALGAPVVVLAMLMLIVGNAAVEYFTMRTSLVTLVAGSVLLLFGVRVFRAALFPLLYLQFMVPLPYILYDAVSFPLKLLVTRISVLALRLSGITVINEGNMIMFPQLTLEVADACSGIRSLVSLFALVVAYAALSKHSPLQRAILVAATIPIAIATNAARVIVTGFLSHYSGTWAAEGFFHEFAGLTVFAVAAALMFLLSWTMRRVAP